MGVSRSERTGSDEEGPQRMLKGGDGTAGVGEGGLQMGEDLRCRLARGLDRRRSRQFRRLTEP